MKRNCRKPTFWTYMNHSFIHSSMALQPFVGPWSLFQFRNPFTQTVGLLERVISPSQGRYLHRTTQIHNKRTNTKHPCLGVGFEPTIPAFERAKTVHALRCVHITRARAGARHACARRETRLAFTCARKFSSTLLQLLAWFRRVRIRIFTRSVYRL
jgi:hypothetical protein